MLTLAELQPILQTVREAARLCHTVQDHYLQRREKTDHEPVTLADYGVQALLARTLHEHFPKDAIVAEENAAEFLTAVPPDQRTEIARLLADILRESVTESDILAWLDAGDKPTAARTWIIDPVDGTAAFLSRRGYAIAIGAVEDGRAVAGVLGCPDYPMPDSTEGRLFFAAEGQAFSSPLERHTPTPIHVSAHDHPTLIQIVEGMESARVDQTLIQHIYDQLGLNQTAILRSDGQVKYGMIACGDGDVYLRIPADHQRRAYVWDHAAGVAILEAAGGKVTDFRGNPLDFHECPVLDGTKFIIITNGNFHDPILAALRQVEL